MNVNERSPNNRITESVWTQIKRHIGELLADVRLLWPVPVLAAIGIACGVWAMAALFGHTVQTVTVFLFLPKLLIYYSTW